MTNSKKYECPICYDYFTLENMANEFYCHKNIESHRLCQKCLDNTKSQYSNYKICYSCGERPDIKVNIIYVNHTTQIYPEEIIEINSTNVRNNENVNNTLKKQIISFSTNMSIIIGIWLLSCLLWFSAQHAYYFLNNEKKNVEFDIFAGGVYGLVMLYIIGTIYLIIISIKK
tara:strand:- start:544 stop:1059 length:516 start_codon:yes stop_codon:yes gene_type:complete